MTNFEELNTEFKTLSKAYRIAHAQYIWALRRFEKLDEKSQTVVMYNDMIKPYLRKLQEATGKLDAYNKAHPSSTRNVVVTEAK